MPSPWPVALTATPAELALAVAAPGLAADRIAEIWFYPREWGVIDHVAPQRATVSPEGIRIEVARGPLPEMAERPVEGVLVVKERLDAGVVEPGVPPAGRPCWWRRGPRRGVQISRHRRSRRPGSPCWVGSSST